MWHQIKQTTFCWEVTNPANILIDIEHPCVPPEKILCSPLVFSKHQYFQKGFMPSKTESWL